MDSLSLNAVDRETLNTTEALPTRTCANKRHDDNDPLSSPQLAVSHVYQAINLSKNFHLVSSSLLVHYACFRSPQCMLISSSGAHKFRRLKRTKGYIFCVGISVILRDKQDKN